MTIWTATEVTKFG